ncbi:hypothetical protein ACO0LO_13755 [Undibacterium sp. TJN25]|uniref:hypothetical protein n=1 Tax=Undibacterium sp. TJN25 TaxID=3413056 RepID=UPI003BF3CE2C
MIDIVVIVILLGLLVAVLTSTIPPRQEGMPQYRYERNKRIPKQGKAFSEGDAGADAQGAAAVMDAGGGS